MRAITNKAVQVHFECVCGYNSVYTETYPIKWKDLTKWGVIRKKDAKTGEPFLLQKQFSKECHCEEIY